MPMPSQLRAEIASGPLAAELALLPAGDDAGRALALNRKDRAGYVPARHVSVSLAQYPALDGLIHWCLNHATLPIEFGGGAVPFAVYALFRNLDRVDKSVDKGDLRATVADLAAGLAAAAASPAAAMIPAGFGDFLLAGEVKISRAEEVWGYGASVSETAVGNARNMP